MNALQASATGLLLALSACAKPPSKLGSAPASAPVAAPIAQRPESAARIRALAEARENVKAIESAATRAFQSEWDSSGVGTGPFRHRFCPSLGSRIPTTIPKGPVAVEQAAWSAEPWSCLRFAVSGPLQCQYAYAANDEVGRRASLTATATCDPDGDGRLLTVTLRMEGLHSSEPWAFRLVVTGADAGEPPPPNPAYVKRVVEGADAACACKDFGCARTARDRSDTASLPELNPADHHAVFRAVERMDDCIAKLP